MKANLIVEPTSMAIGKYFVLYDELYRIQSINDTNINSINITKGTFDNIISSDKIGTVKFLAKYGDKKCEIRYKDCELLDSYNPNDEIEGDIQAYKRQVDVDKQEKVILTSLNIVDKYTKQGNIFGLPSQRFGKLIDYLNNGKYLIQFDQVQLSLSRSEFALVERADTMSIFTIKCPHCGK